MKRLGTVNLQELSRAPAVLRSLAVLTFMQVVEAAVSPRQTPPNTLHSFRHLPALRGTFRSGSLADPECSGVYMA